MRVGRCGWQAWLTVSCAIYLCFAATAIRSSAQTLTTLYNFCSQQNCTDGIEPFANLVQGSDGNFYGTTFLGGGNTCGRYSCGSIFKITANGTLTTLHSFNGTDGSGPPAGSLIQASDGNFYGTTSAGGTSSNCLGGCGTFFKITPSGTLTTLHSFDSTDGSYPIVSGKQAADGNFYGVASLGGASNNCGSVGCGIVFKITTAGAVTTLYNFDFTHGSFPDAGLIQATDGNFYGTTASGGASSNCGSVGCGTVFKITPSGTLTMLYSFCPQAGCADGFYPSASLVQATDGNFYGTTSGGGTSNTCTNGCGTVFRITPSGTLTSLHSFDGSDGIEPLSALVQATDGNLYGTVSYTIPGSGGTVFRMTLGGTLTTLHNFHGTDGSYVVAGLAQASDGNFYGVTAGGGTGNRGTVFSLSVTTPNPVQFVPVTPCRVVDTRNPNGTFGGPPIQGNTTRSFPIPQGGCSIPANAVAYSLNVTVVPSGPLGYLTIWPAGQTQPLVSTMNSLDGRIKANAAIIPAGGSSGAVSVYATNTTDVVLDIDGYFAPGGDSALAFYPLTPCRVLDTRKTNGPLGGPFLNGGQQRDFPVLLSSCIPSNANAGAYSMNFTVVPVGGSLAYLTVWPTGELQPLVSTLNNLTGTIVANAAIVPAGDGGAISVYPSDNTQLVVDIDGYFAAPGPGGLSLYPAVPCRVFDSRKVGGGQPFSGTLTPPVDVVDSACGVPNTAQAYVFNATVVPVGSLSYLTLWPDGEGQPVVSTLNATDGAITSNMAIVPNANGKIDAYAAGLTQLVLDISSYFAP